MPARPRVAANAASIRHALAIARREGRKVFVQVVGDRWREDRTYVGDLIDGPWLDEPPFEKTWASRAQVGDFCYVSGHTRIQRIW